MRIFRQLAIWTVLILSLAALHGCGNSPVGPAPINGSGGGGDPNPSPTGPEILVVNPDGTTSWTQLPPGGGYPAASTSGPGSTGRKVEVAARVDGALGVKLQCGRFYLMVPPGAIAGEGTVTMTMEDSTVMVCDVEIFPKELNGFQKPVSLALCTNDTDASADTLSIYWYDPDRNDWVDMGCDKDLSDNVETMEAPCPVNMRGVMTTLSHFSRYSGGKAGW
jgi:hypothetical protein